MSILDVLVITVALLCQEEKAEWSNDVANIKVV